MPGPAAGRNPSRWSRASHALSPAEWRRAGRLAAAVVGLHVLGFGTLLAAVVPAHYHLGDARVFGVGIGLTAYTLGVRHAFDADHIGAIDNTTRKLIADGQRPLGVGFFFALGHSTIVLVLGVLVSVGVAGLSGAVADDGSTLHDAAGVIGPAVSGTFLVLIGTLNLLVLRTIVGISRGMRRGEFSEAELERQLARRGFMNRLCSRATRAVRRSWQMYPLGCLFGLGFDTATEVGLLVLAGAGAASGLPFYAILCLPVLFAAGMTLFDTLDGAFMNFAYGWALSRPVRKVFYSLAVTAMSVAVALGIGTLELLSVLSDKLMLTGGVWDLAHVDLNVVGYAIVGLFAATWAIAAAVWRLARVEERWSATLQES